jgi:hypothetical protein
MRRRILTGVVRLYVDENCILPPELNELILLMSGIVQDKADGVSYVINFPRHKNK